MTILAGIFSRHREYVVKENDCAVLRSAVSRNPEDKVVTFTDGKVFLAKLDIGAYGETAFAVKPNGSVSMLAGEPLLSLNSGNLSGSRTHDLDLLHEAWEQGEWSLLAETQGVFCAVHYNQVDRTLSLIADKLCIRPLYYWDSEEYVIFATALRIFEDLSIVPKRMDIQAVTEITCFGYPLGTRTPYSNISLLKGSEIVEFRENGKRSWQYWRWDEIPQSRKTETELLKETHGRFMTAIARRLRSDRATIAFLSGGLDSRCVVAGLRSQNIDVHTFNFSPSNFSSFGSQDRAFAAEFARQVGSTHTEGMFDTDFKSSMIMAEALRRLENRRSMRVERPQMVWSGDGGSVGVGLVYLDRTVLDLLRSGKRDSGVQVFLNQRRAEVPWRFLNKRIAISLLNIPRTSILEELNDIHCEDPARGFHIFLLLNDQRRHLSQHFEDIDLHRIEFQLPFFDGGFLASVLSGPIDLFLYHHFYVKWLDQFPSVVTSVPWQTYPGHEPCPLPIPKDLHYQWQFSKFKKIKRKEKLFRQAKELLRANNFPKNIVNKNKLRLATWVYRIGLHDYGYVIKIAQTYYKYWVRSN